MWFLCSFIFKLQFRPISFFLKIRHHLQLILFRVKKIWTRVTVLFKHCVTLTIKIILFVKFVNLIWWSVIFFLLFQIKHIQTCFFRDNFCVWCLTNRQFKIYRTFHSRKTNQQTIMILRWNMHCYHLFYCICP